MDEKVRKINADDVNPRSTGVVHCQRSAPWG